MATKKTKGFKGYLAKIEDPNYQGGSWDLPDNASTLEKAKYKLCQKILTYQQNNNFSDKELAKKMKLGYEETFQIWKVYFG